MKHIGLHSVLVPALALVTVMGCADGGGAVGPDGPLADHTAEACDHDATAPVISSVTASPSQLWPPNHKFVPVAVSVSATDNCSTVSSSIVTVSSSEPVNGLGDGNTQPDWIVTGPLSVLLRSERSGLNDGRTYTISVQSADAAGNISSGTTTVFVPHDKGKHGDR